ncbi:hypothetical protein IAU59_004409 [Kwoniella sp. CBS 9459]
MGVFDRQRPQSLEDSELIAAASQLLSEDEHELSSDYDDDFELTYDDELEQTLQQAESQSQVEPQHLFIQAGPESSTYAPQAVESKVVDIEDSIPFTSTVCRGQEPAREKVLENDGEPETELGAEVEVEVTLSPFAQFRKKGFLSVSDLVGPIWCETQYDYRLRTMPFLPPEKRPNIIKSTAGKEIVVDKIKVEGKERILRRGEKIHKRLEREIHPEEVKVQANTREDVWGLRFLNMFSAVEALLTLGKCREIPVVGFLNDIMIMGIIDEIVREPIEPDTAPATRSRSNQTSLTSFFSPVKTRQKGTQDTPQPRKKTHRLYISDSKTRASGTVPRDEDAVAGKLQVMMYKEMLDAILLSTSPNAAVSAHLSPSQRATSSSSPLPSRNWFSWDRVFDHVSLDPQADFSEGFLIQSRAVVLGNGLRHGAGEARTLNEMRAVWSRYVVDLGLGSPSPSASGKPKPNATRTTIGTRKGKEKEEAQNLGRTEDRLELVYRRAEGKKKAKKPSEGRQSKRRRKGIKSRATTGRTETVDGVDAATILVDDAGEPPPPKLAPGIDDSLAGMGGHVSEEEDRLLQHAIAESLQDQVKSISTTNEPSEGSSSPPLFVPAESPRSLVEAEAQENTAKEEPTVSRPSTRASERRYWGDANSSDDREDDILTRAVEMSLNPDLEREGVEGHGPGEQGESVIVKTTNSQQNQYPTSPPTSDGSATRSEVNGRRGLTSQKIETANKGKSTGAGSIIGKTTFRHSPLLLAAHLESVLGFWMGSREPTGVSLEQTSRCGWCEFEEGCEWR